MASVSTRAAHAIGPRRPLLVAHTATQGGSNVVLEAMLDGAPPGTEPACVFFADGPVAASVAARGVPVAIVETGRAREVANAPRAVRALHSLIRRHESDVVFSHLAKAHLYARPAASLAGVPALWWQHSLPGQQELLHRVAERLGASVIVCSSEFTAHMQRRRTPATPVLRIYPGTASPGPEPAPGNGPPRLVLVSRLQRWKKVERLLDALPGVIDQIPDVRADVIGGSDLLVDRDYPAFLRERARALGIDDALSFVGHADDVGARIAAATALVHTAELEPFGLVVVEAMARGVPVIAPNTGGSAESVRDGVDGLLVDVRDAEALAQAIVDLFRDPDRRSRMGAAGRERARAFSQATMAGEAWRLAADVARDGDGR